MSSKITLVTASLPQRCHLLQEMLNSVSEQTVSPAEHLVIVNSDLAAPKLNRMIEMAETEYVVQVDDDDLLYPNHIATLVENLTADVVWTWCDVTGREWNPNRGYEKGRLKSENYIPSNCAIRKQAIVEAGGHRLSRHHDHDLLQRLEAMGASFKNVPVVTWNYRFGVSVNSSLHV